MTTQKIDLLLVGLLILFIGILIGYFLNSEDRELYQNIAKKCIDDYNRQIYLPCSQPKIIYNFSEVLKNG
jgi:hypothetical protein